MTRNQVIMHLLCDSKQFLIFILAHRVIAIQSIHLLFSIFLFIIFILSFGFNYISSSYSQLKMNNVNALDLQMTNINNDKHVSIVKCFFNESISYPIVSSSIIFCGIAHCKESSFASKYWENCCS